MQPDLQHLWDTYILPCTGTKFLPLFANATRSSRLLDEIIKPTAHTGDTYRSVGNYKYSKGRGGAIASKFACGILPDSHWAKIAYFTDEMEVDAGRGLAPKERAVLGEHIILTFEYDRKNDLPFFREQLGWLRPKKHWEQSKAGQLFRHCSQWVDFVGLTVVWSGGKSLHFHAVFETATYRGLNGAPRSPYDGLKFHWDALQKDVQRIFAPSVRADGTPTTPDTSLKSPVAYRRLPGGQRILDETNLLGIPKGTAVPQLVLWERFRDKATKGVTKLFLSPTHFARGRSRDTSGISATSTIGSTFSAEEIRFCEERLRESYPGYPSLHDLTFDIGRDLWVARFFNSPLDRNPSSVMLEGYTTIQINGSHHVDLPEALIFPLGQMMDIWITRYRREQAQVDAMTDLAAQAANDDCGVGKGSLDEARFEPDFFRSIRAASDGAAARMALETYLPDLIEREKICLLRGPEGVAKTSSIMSRHPEILSRINRPGLALYAFADYRNAQEKCDQFNALGHDRIVGVVWPSFSRVYKELCEEIGIAEIKFADAAKTGFQSLWSEVERKQPQIIEAMQRRHAVLWQQVGNAAPVIFTVHDVAHRWADRNRTRRLWSRTFWDEEADQEQQFEETKLAFLVHDEIKTATFVDLTPASALHWLQLLRSQNPAIWRENHLSLQMQALENHAKTHGWPDGKEIDLNQARRLMGIRDWTAVTTADTGEYAVRACDDPEKDIYGRRHGKTWHVRPRKWWRDGVHHVAPRIILLTTEFVPTAVAQAAHPEIHVLNFETNGVPPDEVELQVERDVIVANLPTILQDRIPVLRADTGQDWSAVSNKSGGLDLQLEIEALTHMAARGSNRLIGRNILQTATFMSQSQYEELQALNAWIGRRDLILMTHIDEINQSCGRNLRFRRQGHERHILLMNRRLYCLLDASGMFGALRYGLALHMDNEARKNSRRKAA